LRKKLLLLGAALVAVFAGYELGQLWRLPEPAKPLAQMTEFVLPDLEGKSHNIKEWRGNLILLNFWATWCPPCREEMPLLTAMQERYGSQGLQIIGVAIDRAEAVNEYRRTMRINYPSLLGGYDAGDILAQYGNTKGALPYSVFITPQGQVAARKFGAYTSGELESLIQSFLPKSQ
jgi:thiol-disulfide isomerase/thioredoxin